MRRYVIILVAFILAGCSGSSFDKVHSSSAMSTPQNVPALEFASADSAKDFLLTSAASDFRTYGPKPILGFRNVYLRYLPTQTGETMYLLCGQFLTERQGGKNEWTPFATIKTSGYEQYLGATKYCEDASVIKGREDDLSSLLQTRFESLK